MTTMSATPPEPLQTCSPAVTLLALPDVLLHEVLSWSPGSATANALLNTCTSLHGRRSDPAAAALLLLRCRCARPSAALTFCGRTCQGGTSAVVQQVLQYLTAGCEVWGAPDARSRLLQAALCVSAWTGNAAHIQALMRLPLPPVIGADGTDAIFVAISNNHLAATRALLDLGAFSATVPPPHCASNPYDCSVPARCLANAACCPKRAAAMMPLLLQHCPPWALEGALSWALHNAVLDGQEDAVALLLPRISSDRGGTWDVGTLAKDAAVAGCPVVLRLLLGRWALTRPQLDGCLRRAVRAFRAQCAEVLLDAGAAVNPAGSCLLLHAVGSLADADVGLVSPRDEGAVRDVLRLLLQRGAKVTPATLTAAAAVRHVGLQELLTSAAGGGRCVEPGGTMEVH